MAEAQPFQPVDRGDRVERAMGSRQLAALLPDPAGMRPAYRHLARAISELILDGRIALHVRLPAERELATALNTSRATVTAVYDLLRESGYAHSRQGSGTWTALPEGRTPSGVTRFLRSEDTAIDLAKAAPALPDRLLADALAQVAPRLAEHAHTPGYHPYGLPELREAVAERFTRRGLVTVPDQILVTSGAQHALTLFLGLMCRPGDRIMVENPSYPNALEAIRRARLRTVSIPVTDTGWDIEIIESTLRQVVPRLAYLIPDFQNPTGCLMPDEERVRVLRAAQRSGTWLVVDETLADLALDVPAPPPFASRAAPGGAGQVVTIGSMSKTHWGGLRIGWLRAPSRLVTELAGQRVATDIGGSVLDQLLALTFLTGTDDLLPARLAQMREQRATLVAALSEHIPGWTWRLPPGGLSIWVDLGEPVAAALSERALACGVRIESGAYFATDPGVFEQRLRIPYTTPSGTLREAVRRLAAALADDLPLSVAARPHWIA
ncbi:GntR family transcriptional regulator [Microtetraspora sp. NBRC 13810]|uniref:MocR-like transcription factor YczR n=1 Tax=Microtetraspora sp. NBRC 13810 TaxID=3030990 RepID=UPI0024A4FD89|nr:PLP-dependent aminotransferase family protein [Microtetraspora sp. NBRC 13810]GLW09432.1 GntR family transcriptional regulator [Microtetraspora sp. NBRC 13810]